MLVKFEIFSSVEEARSKLAILDKWSKMSEKAVFRLRPDAEVFFGRASAQGSYPVGGKQIFVPDFARDLIEVLP